MTLPDHEEIQTLLPGKTKTPDSFVGMCSRCEGIFRVPPSVATWNRDRQQRWPDLPYTACITLGCGGSVWLADEASADGRHLLSKCPAENRRS